ncbi:type I restriction enzyme, S subunit [Chryseobacterium carnipullorum]|uniref:restriction endonuclease subunit S n=1 Tax=Chryseobacterium carnipullorum TaxID=1124835 RepID=UPI000918A14A|nr:restriction endonuclease subunit S [Chryseobacterium carnipullorum]SHM01577.1 type I restriction enzyme, S subunit [Chryseobacterium carnipullorum]
MVKESVMKQTEIGLLPEDWDVINLEKNFTLKARIGWQGLTTAEYLDNGNYGLVTGTDFKGGYIDWNNCVFVEKMRFDQDRNIQLKNGDVLVTKDGTIGKIAYVDFLPKPTTLNSGVFVVRPKSNSISNRFFYYVLMSFYFDDFLLKITAGSTITHLYQKDFVNFNFVCPPLPEQEAIAEALSDADAWIESLEQLIAKKRLIKQGAMQELLTPKEDWEVKKLGEVTIDGGLIRGPFGGALKKDFFVKNGYKVYEQKNAIYKSVHLGKYFVDTAKFKELGRFEIKANDFILSCSGTIGKLFRIPQIFQKGIINQALLIIRLNSTIIDFGYFGHIFQYDTIQSKIIDDTQGGAMKNLVGMSEFRNTEIPLPSLTEQIRIATILSDMDAELEALEVQLGKARKVKQGMMQELLTGRVRLV